MHFGHYRQIRTQANGTQRCVPFPTQRALYHEADLRLVKGTGRATWRHVAPSSAHS